MALQIDFSKAPEDPTKIHEGGSRPMPGRGMAMITSFNEYGGVNGTAHELEMEIVAWTTPESVGMIHTDNIFTQDKSGKGFPMKRLQALCMAAGLFTAREAARWKKAGETPDIQTEKLAGRPIMLELVEEAGTGANASKTFLRIGNFQLGFWHIKDPKVKDWPKNQSLYNAHAAAVGEWVTELTDSKTKTVAANGAATSAAGTAGASGAADPFAGKV